MATDRNGSDAFLECLVSIRGDLASLSDKVTNLAADARELQSNVAKLVIGSLHRSDQFARIETILDRIKGRLDPQS